MSAGNTFCFAVSAVCSGVESSLSDYVCVTTPSALQAGEPANVVVGVQSRAGEELNMPEVSEWSDDLQLIEPTANLQEIDIEVSVAPNPTRVSIASKLSIKTDADGAATITVADITRRILSQSEQNFAKGLSQIDLQPFEKVGIYIVSVRTATTTTALKVVVVE